MAFGVIQRRTGELPAEVTGFVGRTAELRQLVELLGQTRLVTVVGPGGVGKTRIALRAAARLAGHYTDGVCLVELTGLRDPELLAHTLATCLGLPERQSRDRLDVLLDHLRDRRIMLILDTCEHLVDACAMLTDVLLREARGVTVLATSRQPLDVPGEATLQIHPLPVDEGPAAGHAPGGDAVELFAQRAAAVVPGFAVTDRNRADVLSLCRRLDGIPLAIELAAVRLRTVPLRQLVDRLEDRFRLLTGGRRTALPRHQTLRTAIDWSYGLCEAPERLLWARLSIFAGTFDTGAVEEVCADSELPRTEIQETLIRLVDKSVVLRVDDGEGGTRYRLLDTLREYGAERGELGAERLRYVERYAGLARHFGGRFLDDDQLDRVQALHREHADIRAALEYAFALPGGDALAARLAGDLWGYWLLSGHLTEGRYWQTRVLQRFPQAGPERVRALCVRGALTMFQRDFGQAYADLNASADLGGGDTFAARACGFLQLLLAVQGCYADSAAAGAEAERRLCALGDHIGLSFLHMTRSFLSVVTGDADGALEHCARSWRRLGPHTREHWLSGYLFWVTGMAHLQRGAYDEAADALHQALRLKRAVGDPLGAAYVLESLSWLASELGRHERATVLLGAASAQWRRLGSTTRVGPALIERHQAVETAASVALGAERFTALLQSGAGSPLEAVVDFALGETEDAQDAQEGEDAEELEAAGPGAPGGADGLTRREREVAALVAQGLSNRQIADRLVLSKRTVDAHLEHILTKVGASSRTEIATRLAAGGR
ncbi:ATP-binding protein [Streptomyces boncukensis]|uniref:AAA family ATPase n=1 Tax=Streptomyces boncukensis TaxID=2711219 RepID=A0A6G4X363_9ACTN|nr:LuxR C-terminal-related transcriptional regulator [Streptomyces boncukensis]NGO71572.1 AAA family ATPase [Streptomyces boncukensis]